MSARVCDYNWILSLRAQCIEKDVPFCFHQTGAHFLKDGKTYFVKRKYQIAQAKKAGIDYKVGADSAPEQTEEIRLAGF